MSKRGRKKNLRNRIHYICLTEAERDALEAFREANGFNNWSETIRAQLEPIFAGHKAMEPMTIRPKRVIKMTRWPTASGLPLGRPRKDALT